MENIYHRLKIIKIKEKKINNDNNFYWIHTNNYI